MNTGGEGLRGDSLYLGILERHWGYTSFRSIQLDIIRSVCAGRDTLGLMPTGGGKSLTFQVPALALPGVCMVVTPLVALMKDQVRSLLSRGIRAACIHAGMKRSEVIATLENAIFGGVKLLYVSPERLSSEIFLKKLGRIPVSLITVDEAHCISQWGYDFRPAYLEIARIRAVKPEAPVLALTATATPEVAGDIMDKLAFKDGNVYRMSFTRPNLAYIVRTATDKAAALANILSIIHGSAIVYTRSRAKAKEVAAMLADGGVGATFYHAGLETSVKDERQKQWTNGDVRVMVATNAFGMGIDKPDVRLVAHMDCPDSVEAYFQEAGRAGRNGLKAYAVLLYNDGDRRKLEKRIADNFPPKDYIRRVYEDAACYLQVGAESGAGRTFAFPIDDFCSTFKHFPLPAEAALRILSQAGYVDYEPEADSRARVRFTLGRAELSMLSGLPPGEEAVAAALLRTYGGLFSDYSYIDLALVARAAGMEQEKAYLCLKALGHRKVVHFVPQSKAPTLTYLKDRVPAERISIPPGVYEERRTQYARRVKAMEAYAGNGRICRSQQLVRYFGEKGVRDCHMCDVCQRRREENSRGDTLAEAKDAIRRLLADMQPHPLTEIAALGRPAGQLAAALQYLADEEEVEVRCGKARLLHML